MCNDLFYKCCLSVHLCKKQNIPIKIFKLFFVCCHMYTCIQQVLKNLDFQVTKNTHVWRPQLRNTDRRGHLAVVLNHVSGSDGQMSTEAPLVAVDPVQCQSQCHVGAQTCGCEWHECDGFHNSVQRLSVRKSFPVKVLQAAYELTQQCGKKLEAEVTTTGKNKWLIKDLLNFNKPENAITEAILPEC